jgi:hypothetical protein
MIIIRSIRISFINMKNELAIFIAIIVSFAILFMSTIINGNIISAQANKNNSSSVQTRQQGKHNLPQPTLLKQQKLQKISLNTQQKVL